MSSTTRPGVPAGANRPYHWVTSTPATPASCKVGTSGSAAALLGPAIASAWSLPVRIQGCAVSKLENISWVRPATVSLSAADDPRYVTPVMSTPAASLNSSAAKCGAVPSPADAYAGGVIVALVLVYLELRARW